jgi:hypothetical protein
MYEIQPIHAANESDGTHPITRLCNGHPVALKMCVVDRVHKRQGTALLFLCPLSVFNGDTAKLLVAVDRGRAEVMDLHRLRVQRFFVLGIQIQSAKVLISEINKRLRIV